MWQHVCLVLATAAVASSFSIQNAFPQVRFSKPLFQVTQDQRPLFRSSQDQKYDCPHEGFFINPRNCSQFYRCVDYTHTGYVYSVYAFECPRYHVFILDGENSTCVPGTECGTGTQTVPHVPDVPITTQRPTGSTSRPTSLRPLTVAPTFPTTARPTLPPVTPDTSAPVTPGPDRPFDPPLPPVVECRGQYVQHEMFCNVYYKCSYEADKFLCPAGSLFDTVRQMCRIQAADEDLCGGKSIYSQSFRYVSNIPFESIGSRTHLPTPISSYRPQQYLVPQSQPNYLAYFDPTHPMRMNPNQQTPLQYVQPITSPFTQGHSGGHSYRVSSNVIVPEVIMSHPEPDTAFTPKFYQVVDGEKSTISQPKPENVHPRQHFVQFNEASQPLAEVVNPRQYYRPVQYRPTAKTVHPRQYYRAIDSELDASEYY